MQYQQATNFLLFNFYSTPCGVATGCGSIHGGNPALSALKYFGPNIRDTQHKAYLSPFPYDVL